MARSSLRAYMNYPTTARVNDLVLAAGGLTPKGDVSGLDLAATVTDGQTVIVPGRCLNINTATVEEFDSLPGIGPSRAADIIAARRQLGGFSSVQDLTMVGGIGPATLDRITTEDCVTVDANMTSSVTSTMSENIGSSVPVTTTPSNCLNINTATAAELDEVTRYWPRPRRRHNHHPPSVGRLQFGPGPYDGHGRRSRDP